MLFTFRLIWIVVLSTLVTSRCRADDLPARIHAAMNSAAEFLVAKQSSDGAWRSQVYGFLKDGPSLTPQVVASLHLVGSGPETAAASHRGALYLSKLLDPDGNVDPPLKFPVYTAAIAAHVAVIEGQDEGHVREQSAWLSYLRKRQLDARLGWSAADPEYGGWGYSVAIPQKPPAKMPLDPLAASNVSATVYALDALQLASNPSDDSARAAAIVFLQRCQNLPADLSAGKDPVFDDGGFFLMPGDAARNKAGMAGTDRNGHIRFHSYGAATADGLRALLDAGLPTSHPRVVAARRWVELNFNPRSNPGVFQPDREVLRNSAYYYYASSISLALLQSHDKSSPDRNTDAGRARDLADELLRRQRGDGSWSNPLTDAMEDDPLISTPAAMTALDACLRLMEMR